MRPILTEILEKPYEENFYLLEADCDFVGRMLPGAALRAVQQVATNQCLAAGMDAAFYARTRSVFLLAKQTLRFFRAPTKNERYRYTTFAETPRRVSVKRITAVTDESGEARALVDSRWVLVDLDTRRILRHFPEGYPAHWIDTVPEELPQSIERCQELTELGEGRAGYALCDANLHLNNTRYADLVCNALPPELMRENEITEMRLHYHWEIPMGEGFTLSLGSVRPGVQYVAARHAGRLCFEAETWLALRAPARPE